MTDDINIRRCHPDDANTLALLGRATFLETFAGILDGASILAHCESQHAAGIYAAWLQEPSVSIWIAETGHGGAPVGYLVLTRSGLPIADLRADDLEIKRIYLLHRFHGGGLGKRLLAHAVLRAQQQQATRLLLGVYANNAAALAFYLRQGFRKVGERVFNVGGRDYDDTILAMDI